MNARARTHTLTHMHPQPLSQADAEVLTVSLFRVMRPPMSCLWPLALSLLVCDSACELRSLTIDSDSMHITADHNLMNEIFFERNFFMKTTQIKWSTDLEARLKAGNINLYYFQTPVTLKLGQGCLNCYMPCRLSLYSTLQTRSKTVRTLPTFLSLFKNLSSISLFWDTSVFVCWNLNLLCQHAYILRICQRLGPVHARHFKSKCSVLVLQVPIFSIISVYQDTSSTAKHQPPEKIHRQAAGRNDYRDKLWMIRWSRNYREKLWMIRWSRNYRDKLWIRWSRNYREKLWMIRWSRNYRDKLWMLRWSRNYSGHPSKHKQER